MTCQSCKASTETSGLWAHYDSPKCIYCTARLVRDIGKLQIAQSLATTRRGVVLADAIAYGHQEVDVRRLHKSGPWVQPVEVKKKR